MRVHKHVTKAILCTCTSSKLIMSMILILQSMSLTLCSQAVYGNMG